MKKLLYLFLTVLLIFPISAYAISNDKNSDIDIEEVETAKQETVTLEECVDVTTVKLRNSNDEIFKVKLLAIDEVEDEDLLTTAKQYVCNTLVDANKIIIEYDTNGKEEDSYGRKLVWLFTDDELLQNKLVVNGYATVNTIYDTYKYTSTLQDSEIIAKKNKVGKWQEKKEQQADEIKEEKKNKKGFFRSLFDNVLGAIVKFIDDILEKLLNLIEDML